MNATIFLYIFIFFSTTILMKKSQLLINGKVKYRKGYFILAFFIHWFFLTFTNIGADYNNYIRIINNISAQNITKETEMGFNLVCFVLKTITHNNDITIFFIKTLTLILFYIAFRLLYEDVDIGICVLAFNLILYLQGFFILGMQLAIAFLLLSGIQLKHKKNIRAIILLIIAGSIHASCWLFVPIYVLYLYFTFRTKKIKPFFIALICIIYGSIYLSAGQIMQWAINNISQFSQYSIYGFNSTNTNIGFMQIVYFIPIFYFCYIMYKKDNSYVLKNMTIIFSVTAFLFALLGYKIDVFARINKSFFVIYGVLIPALLWDRKNYCSKNMCINNNAFIFNYRSDVIIWVTYLFIRGIDIFIDLGLTTSSAAINPYSFFNPF